MNHLYFPGSLAKGTTENVTSLVDLGAATALVELLKTAPWSTKLVAAGLCALRSIFLHPPAPISTLPADTKLLSRLTRKLKLTFLLFYFNVWRLQILLYGFILLKKL